LNSKLTEKKQSYLNFYKFTKIGLKAMKDKLYIKKLSQNISGSNLKKVKIILQPSLLLRVLTGCQFEHYKETKVILSLILSGEIIGYISDLQFKLLEKLAQLCMGEQSSSLIKLLKENLQVYKVSQKNILRASQLTVSSFDTALAIACAEEEHIDAVVTETTEVISDEYKISVLKPEEFILRYSFDENKLLPDATPPDFSPRKPSKFDKEKCEFLSSLSTKLIINASSDRIHELQEEPEFNFNGWKVESFDVQVTLDRKTEAKISLWNPSQGIGINKNAYGNGPVNALVNAFSLAMPEIAPERHLPLPTVDHVFLESAEQGADSPVNAQVAIETDENERYTGKFIDTDTVKAVFYAYLEAVSEFIKKPVEKTRLLHKESAEELISKFFRSIKELFNISLSRISLDDKKLDGLCLENAVINGSDLRRSTFSTYISKAEWKNVHISSSNLTNIVLEEADLKQIEIVNSDLSHANLIHADLAGAKISSSHFVEAKMNKINLSYSQITSSSLTEADLDNAILNGANLSKLNLDKVNFKEAKLINAFFGGASLIEAKFMDADLTRTNFQRANLSNAKFSDANLTEAKLEHTIFAYANLSGAVLEKLDLTTVELTGAKLDNAKLYGSKIKRSQLKNVNIENLSLAGVDLINDSDDQDDLLDSECFVYQI
jgi:uncharacterized protein YjbI with pentapeptide repeats